MKKLCAVILLASYVAFVPVCFSSSTLGPPHVHEGGATGATNGAHDTSTPLATHAEMYSVVTSASFTESELPRFDALLPVLFSATLFLLAWYFTLFATPRIVDRLRRVQHALACRQTFLRYLARLIASPNSLYALA